MTGYDNLCRGAKWVIWSIIGAAYFYYLSRTYYFKLDAFLWNPFETKENFESIHSPNHWVKAQIIYIVSILATCYAAFIIATLTSSNTEIKFTPNQAAFHLAVWTLGPPLWFSFERYFLYTPNGICKEDLKASLDLLKEAQDYASKFWAAILAVMISFQLGEIIKGKSNAPATATTSDSSGK